MSETKALRWAKASERLPIDENWKAARHASPGGEYEYSQFAVEGDRFFIGQEETWIIDEISATILANWEWLEEYTPDANPVDMPSRPVENVHQSVSKAGQIEVRCPNCLGEGTEVRSEFGPQVCSCCGGLKNVVMDVWEEWTREYGGNQTPQPAIMESPSKEGAGQDPHGAEVSQKYIPDVSVREEYTSAQLRKRLREAHNESAALQSQLSRMMDERDQYREFQKMSIEERDEARETLRISAQNEASYRQWMEQARSERDARKAERDEYYSELQQSSRERDKAINDLENDTAVHAVEKKELAYYREQSEVYRKAWEDATALLEGKNLDNAQHSEIRKEIEERHAYLRAEEIKAINELDGLVPGSLERTAKWAFIRECCARRNELLSWINKYKKEEPKP